MKNICGTQKKKSDFATNTQLAKSRVAGRRFSILGGIGTGKQLLVSWILFLSPRVAIVYQSESVIQLLVLYLKARVNMFFIFIKLYSKFASSKLCRETYYSTVWGLDIIQRTLSSILPSIKALLTPEGR